MPNNISMTAAATEEAAATAAKSSSVYAVVTPTGDEFELLPHRNQTNDNVSFDTAAVATVSAATPPAAAAAIGGNAFPSSQYYPPPSSISTASAVPPSYAASSFQSLAVTPAAASLLMPACPTNNRGDNDSHDYDEAMLLMEAAKALCSMKNLGAGCPQQHHGTVVNMAMKMMLSSPSATIAQDDDDCWQQQQQQHNNDMLLQEGSLLQYIAADDSSSTASDYVQSNSLTHPDRLAIDDDVDEVNKLHQYVRKELLEIFVVPQISDSDSEEESDDDDYDEDYRATKKSRKNNDPPSLPTTRSAAAARREQRSSSSSSASSSAMASSITASTNSTQRHYPGRVGFRCVHCADCRRKTASKAAFFPLRLTNIYREVCAWQRIHFKTCPMVPAGVRKRYDHYKQVDTSRGKVRYWETSAKKIGLQNNPDR